MAAVIDASAAVQVAIGSVDGCALQQFILEEEDVFAPDFLQIECANVFWKYVHAGKLTAKHARMYYRDAASLVTRYVRQNDLMDEVLAAATRLDHSVYDLIYLVLARRMDATLISLDRRLIDLCESEGVDCVMPVLLSE